MEIVPQEFRALASFVASVETEKRALWPGHFSTRRQRSCRRGLGRPHVLKEVLSCFWRVQICDDGDAIHVVHEIPLFIIAGMRVCCISLYMADSLLGNLRWLDLYQRNSQILWERRYRLLKIIDGSLIFRVLVLLLLLPAN